MPTDIVVNHAERREDVNDSELGDSVLTLAIENLRLPVSFIKALIRYGAVIEHAWTFNFSRFSLCATVTNHFGDEKPTGLHVAADAVHLRLVYTNGPQRGPPLSWMLVDKLGPERLECAS